MATRNVQIIISVKDAATKKMNKVERSIKRTGKAAKTTTNKFKDFNRTLFATTAFVGTFIKAFSALSNSITKGAQLDRLESQFERVLGPSGNLIGQIRNLTDTAIDRMEVMRSGIALANLGIAKSSEETATIIAMAGAAARRAGLDSAEGVKRVTQFLKDGSVSQLEFLNVLKSTNPRLQAQLGILSSTGGAMGRVLTTQARLRLGMNALRAATDGNLKGFRDLQDVTTQMRDSFGYLTRSIGKFLGTALAPMIDNMSMFFDRVASGLEHIRKNEKEIMFLTKAMVVGTGAALGLAGAIGTVRLATMALGSLGFGLPMLIGLAGTLSAAFLSVTGSADSVIDKLKLFGAFTKGVWQLVTSLDEETGFAKIDKNVADLLRNAGILEFTQNVARAISVVKSFATGLVSGLKSALDTVINVLGKLSSKFREITGMDAKGPWSMEWLTNAKAMGEFLGSKFLPIVGALAGLKMAGGLFSKLPIIGGLFGGGGRRGSSPTNPMYTQEVGAGVQFREIGAIKGLPGKIRGSFAGLLGFLKGWNPFSKGNMAVILSKFGRFGPPIAKLARGVGMLLSPLKFVGGALAKTALGLTTLPGALAGALAAGVGVMIGKAIEPAVTSFLNKNTTAKTSEGFEGNILERAFFKLDKMVGGDASKNFMKHQGIIDKLNAGQTPTKSVNTGARSQVSVPNQPEGEDAQLDYLGNQLKELKGDERQRFAEAIKDARLATGAGGMQITPQEWRDIFLGALEASENLKTIAEKAKEPMPSGGSGSRRSKLMP